MRGGDSAGANWSVRIPLALLDFSTTPKEFELLLNVLCVFSFFSSKKSLRLLENRTRVCQEPAPFLSQAPVSYTTTRSLKCSFSGIRNDPCH